MTISNASVCRISVSCFVPIPTTITFGAGDEERWLSILAEYERTRLLLIADIQGLGWE